MALKKGKDSISVENKISIILEANELIEKKRSDTNVFETYREQFLKESQDVIIYLTNNYNELKEKILASDNYRNSKYT